MCSFAQRASWQCERREDTDEAGWGGAVGQSSSETCTERWTESGEIAHCREPTLAELSAAAGRSQKVVTRLQRAQRQIEVSLEAPRPSLAAMRNAEGVRACSCSCRCVSVSLSSCFSPLAS